MSPIDIQPPRNNRSITVLIMVAALLVMAIVGYKFVPTKGATQSDSPSNSVSVSQSAGQITNGMLVRPKTNLPVEAISAEGVLAKLDNWTTNHQNCHSKLETSFPGGSLVGKMDIYSYTNGTDEIITKLKAEMFSPAMKFQGVKENGKLRVYFPQSDQMIEPDMTRMMVDMPSMAGTAMGAKALLKLAKSSFAESAGDTEVVTLVIGSEKLKIPQASGDVTMTMHINREGRLLSVDQQAQGQRIITTMNYISFDRETIMHEAPVMPTGKNTVTNKTLVQAMQEEVGLVISKPLRTKI